MVKYKYNEKPDEEYIDLALILKNLYVEVDKFLNPIIIIAIILASISLYRRFS